MSAIPDDLTAKVTGVKSVRLDWTHADSYASYNVYRSIKSGSEYALIGNTSENFFEDSGLSKDTTYYYVITVIASER